ncbi:MAG: lytic murein transglycosylase [Candidatus Liptonbacteria bacterium]
MLTILFTLSLSVAEPEVNRLVMEALLREGFSRQEAAGILADSRLTPYPLPFEKPAGGISWRKYTSDLLQDESVQNGRRFMDDNLPLLLEIERVYGVPKEYLVTIARIETNLGKFLGEHSVLRVFWGMTKRRRTPAERKKAAGQFAAAAAYCRANGISDCFSLGSSYAGAIGLTQFLPLTLKEDGVDWDKDGSVNVFRPTDALASTANFLARKGWSSKNRAKCFAALARYYGLAEQHWNRPYSYPKAALLYAETLKREPADAK